MLLLSWAPSTPGRLFYNTPIHVDLARPEFIGAPSITLSGSGSGAGFGTIGFHVDVPPALVGTFVYGQWLVLDPDAPDGLASTRGVRYRVL